MSYMADRDHIAITSGDASTTRRKVSVPGCPVTPPITVTQGDSSDTYRRIAADSEIVSGEAWPARPGVQLASSNSAPVRPLEHRHGELPLTPGRPVDRGADLGDGLITAQRINAEQAN